MKGVFLDRDSVDAGDLDLGPIEEALPDWEFFGHTDPDQIGERIRDANVVITNKTRLEDDALADAENLTLVCVAATGVNILDLETARTLGITVCNVRDYASEAVAQHTMAMILNLNTRMNRYIDAVKQGRWSESRHFCMLDFPIDELAGQHLAIVGGGHIGRSVARLAVAFGMRISYAHIPGRPMREGYEELHELLPRADVLSLHCPLSPLTENLIGARELAQMKDSAILINTARGPLIDEAALARALRDRQIGGAGLDVLSNEPPPVDHPLLAPDLHGLIITPHVAWASRRARQRLVDQLARNLRGFLAGKPLNVVNA